MLKVTCDYFANSVSPTIDILYYSFVHSFQFSGQSKPTNAFVAIAGREMEGRSSLVISRTGVYVVFQQPSY